MADSGTGLYNAFFEQMYGQGVDLGALAVSYVGIASGSVFGCNPPFTVNALLAVYPKFFGPASSVVCTTTLGNNQIAVASTNGMAIGQIVTGPGVPAPSVITSILTGAVTISQQATASASGVSLNFYQAPVVPTFVLQMYINLARASLMQARWQEMWPMAMVLYVAHFATLWLQTESGPNSTAAQIANSGLQQGIITSQAAGDVSVSLQPLAGFDDWGSFGLTQYGIQFATMARAIGSGPIYVGSGVGRYPGAF